MFMRNVRFFITLNAFCHVFLFDQFIPFNMFSETFIVIVFKDAIACYEFSRPGAANTTMADAFRNVDLVHSFIIYIYICICFF
jgi:hypothetical protein